MAREKIPEIHERTYAGVLGKIIGVYLGRPVEGWPYEQIQARFGEVDRFIHEDLGLPLIVADDDLSGTFGFFRALTDRDDCQEIHPALFGEHWLNTIIEDRTILWWGGLGRSTEHTAYHRLKEGIPAPQSGSQVLNGFTLATQIGAQIFTDGYALMSPGDPEQATALIRAAAAVSHDGIALDCAAYLGALQALAFQHRHLDALFAAAEPFAQNDDLRRLVDEVREVCQREDDWWVVREWIQEHHGYGVYHGPCPIQTNHAAVLAALWLGGDDFTRSVTIAASAGWDTDCNAGSVGCLNGIRLGLASLPPSWRAQVADRLLVVTAEGGRCIRDAVLETRDILRASAAFRGGGAPQQPARFAFEFPGARQGFAPCPYAPGTQSEIQFLDDGQPGLSLRYSLSEGQSAHLSTPVFLDFDEVIDHFGTHASPTLYPTQEVHFAVQVPETAANAQPTMQPYALYYDADDARCELWSEMIALQPGLNECRWRIPANGGMPLFRLGLALGAPLAPLSGELRLLRIDWNGAPQDFHQQGMMMTSIWNLQPHWLRAWVSAARDFAPDFADTYCVSHREENGLVTLGTREWRNYAVESRLRFSLHDAGGLVLRAQGLRRYYAAMLRSGEHLSICARQDGRTDILAEVSFPYETERHYRMRFSAEGDRLTLSLAGQTLLTATDDRFDCGGAGFLVERGTMLADGFRVCAIGSG
ncbi:MAG: ADP-ribosylglycohydrolase family protein [Chloroflexi bacterium]|nr:ADP-ribosylglycohydrolase family protein [Chloroflexota bacterium]